MELANKFAKSFIDGTVAGTPADLTVYKDTSYSHDHTYYGRGCRNGWGVDGDGGSITPCADSDAGGQYVATADGETQKTGVFYHFQATTVGTGNDLTTDNAVVTDSFCPLGWQLPYGGTGGDYYDKSKSNKYLFNEYAITSGAPGVTSILSYPISYIMSGRVSFQHGRLYMQEVRSQQWKGSVRGAGNGYYFAMGDYSFNTDDYTTKAMGLPIRCSLILALLKSNHNQKLAENNKVF